MKAKLIKHGHSYALLKEGKLIAFAHPEDFSNDNTIGKLSFKNCEVIANGYDLDELAEECSIDWNGEVMEGSCGIYKEGFQKALKLLGDKKFSDEDMISAFHDGWYCKSESKLDGKEKFIQSLQQTEWEVIVEMEDKAEKVSIEKARSTQFSIERAVNAIDEAWFPKPKLDADGCLILKRKQYGTN